MANQLPAGETALVTGAGNGMGQAMALGLARESERLLLAEVGLPLHKWFAPVVT